MTVVEDGGVEEEMEVVEVGVEEGEDEEVVDVVVEDVEVFLPDYEDVK